MSAPADRRRPGDREGPAAAIPGLVLVSGNRLAVMFGKSADWWARNRDALEAKGFPRPVPGVPGMYDPVAVRRWLDRQMPPHLQDAQPVRRPAEAEEDANARILRLVDERLPAILNEI